MTASTLCLSGSTISDVSLQGFGYWRLLTKLAWTTVSPILRTRWNTWWVEVNSSMAMPPHLSTCWVLGRSLPTILLISAACMPDIRLRNTSKSCRNTFSCLRVITPLNLPSGQVKQHSNFYPWLPFVLSNFEWQKEKEKEKEKEKGKGKGKEKEIPNELTWRGQKHKRRRGEIGNLD